MSHGRHLLEGDSLRTLIIGLLGFIQGHSTMAPVTIPRRAHGTKNDVPSLAAAFRV